MKNLLYLYTQKTLVTLFIVMFLSVLSVKTKAINYYCDPVAGSMNNEGTPESPWGSLEDVFTSNKNFEGGDTIFLRTGYHGSVSISGQNNTNVTIQAETGHTPTLKNLVVSNASKWVISGLTVSPEVVGEYTDYRGIINIKSNCSNIIVENCLVYNAKDVSGWDASTVLDRFSIGISCDAPDCEIRNNHVTNTRYAISVSHNATGTAVRYNLIENISEDGIRCLANYMVAEYNVLQNWYGLNDAHDDGFQCWTGGHDGIAVGTETKYGGVIRGNIVIATLDGNPFPPTYGTQGIGWFDGMFEDYLIENNLICTNMWHGIAIYGAINCKIINNTIVKNPFQTLPGVPWIRITAHKNGTPSSGNIIRNNLTTSMSNDDDIGVIDHNIVSADYAAHFVDWAGLNFHLIPTSSAIDAGTKTDAPDTDLSKMDRTEPYDIGCYEYLSTGETIQVSGVSFISKQTTLIIGETTELEVKILPATASNKTINWSSDNNSIASVDEHGTITAIAEGIVNIYITTEDGGYSDNCTVFIVKNENSIVLIGDTDDQAFRSDGSSVWAGQPSARVGGAGELDGVFVIPFELPALNEDEVISDVKFSVHLAKIENSPQCNVDLYAIPFRSTSSVVSSDYYAGDFGADTKNEAIQDDFATISNQTGIIVSSDSASENLATYINKQYSNGAKAGDFIFLRLNPDNEEVGSYNYWQFSTSDDSIIAYRPLLILERKEEINTGFYQSSKYSQNIGSRSFIEVFPNPKSTVDKFRILLHANNQNEEVSIKIFDLSGRIEFSKNIFLSYKDGQNEIFINTNINQGVYILSVSTGTNVYQQKLIIK